MRVVYLFVVAWVLQHGVTAMVKAAYEGRASHLRCLYKHGGDPTLGNSVRQHTPLYITPP